MTKHTPILDCDREAIDRIIDRCDAGGSDNHFGDSFDEDKARHQFELQFDMPLSRGERDALEAYFDAEIAKAKGS